MNRKVIVCVTNDLTTDQRVHKTCTVLKSLGFEVLLYGRILNNSLSLSRNYSTLRIKHFFNSGPLFYAEFNIRLFFFLLFNRFNLVFSNDLDTLMAAFLASKCKRKKIIYDTHEYFTETPELVNRPFVQNIWKAIENFIFPKLIYIITVNNSIAALYAEKFAKKIQVVRNIPMSFDVPNIKSRVELGLPIDKKIIILQGSGINIQRGAEEAVEAMKQIENSVLLIAGAGDVIDFLKKYVIDNKLDEKVIFKSKMPYEDLLQYTANSDLGLAIDKNTNINYQFSLPNKLFDYIHAGIPVLASNLVELKNIIDEFDVGYFIDNHDPEHIAKKINEIFSNEVTYLTKKGNTKRAKKELCWENESKKLSAIISKSL